MKFKDIVLSICLAATGCAQNDEPVSDEANLNLANSISAKVPGMTVWVARAARPDWRYDQRVWIVEGRASKNLASTFSFAADDEFGETLVVSSRKFEVVLDNPAIVHLLQGHKLWIEIETSSGSETKYFASITLAPRFGKYTGSSKIFVVDGVAPVVVGGDTLFRARASLGSGTTALAAADGDAAPEGFVKAGSKWLFDWTWPNLVLAAESVGPVHFTATGSSGPVSKDAVLELAVSALTLQTGIPEQPDFECAEDVRECLESIPAGDEDTSACGDAREVKNCIWEVPMVAGPQRFAHDLTSHLLSWYWEHAADVAQSDGKPLIEGLASVHAGEVVELTDPADDPHGHDFSTFTVFSHPDVVWPGSDNVWFGAYNRQTGQLQSVYGFN